MGERDDGGRAGGEQVQAEAVEQGEQHRGAALPVGVAECSFGLDRGQPVVHPVAGMLRHGGQQGCRLFGAGRPDSGGVGGEPGFQFDGLTVVARQELPKALGEPPARRDGAVADLQVLQLGVEGLTHHGVVEVPLGGEVVPQRARADAGPGGDGADAEEVAQPGTPDIRNSTERRHFSAATQVGRPGLRRDGWPADGRAHAD